MFLALLDATTQAFPANGSNNDAQLIELERVWNDAQIRGDVAVLDALWADDFIVIVPGMAPMGKPEALSFAKSGRMTFSRYETSDLRVRIFESSAIVSGKLFRSRTIAGTLREDDGQFMKVYVRHNGRRMVVAFTASEAPGS
jgi:hypothetical protein